MSSESQTKEAEASRETELRHAAAKEAAAERRRKLITLSPQFVEVIKLGQPFVRFTETQREDVFVWFDQPEGRIANLHWEPLIASEETSDSYNGLAQPKTVIPENTIKFSSISDIYMGRTNEIFSKHSDVNTKLCLTFATHADSGSSLNLMARSRPQLEAWIYGIQYILKQGGFQFVEANENADKAEREIFQKYTAKQLVRLIMKNDPITQSIRLQATLTQMNRGQTFTRHLPDGTTTTVHVFFCSDGGKGTIFWGQRTKPDGYIPLRTVTDMWLGRHGIKNFEDVDASFFMSLASKKALLALQAPNRGIMTQWVYGIHSLLTATPEVLAEINKAHVQQAEQQKSAQAQAQASAQASAQAGGASGTSGSNVRSEAELASAHQAIAQMQDNALQSDAVDGDAAFQAEAAAALSALRNLAIMNGTENFWTEDTELDMSQVDAQVLAQADAIELEASKIRSEFEAALEARKALELAKKQDEQAQLEKLDHANTAAEDALAKARALREAAAKSTQSAMDHLMSMTEQFIGDDDDDEEDSSAAPANTSVRDDTAANTSSVLDSTSTTGTTGSGSGIGEDDEEEPAPRPRHGRRLSIFSSLELDDDIRNILSTLDKDTPSSPTEEDNNEGADVEYTDIGGGEEDDQTTTGTGTGTGTPVPEGDMLEHAIDAIDGVHSEEEEEEQEQVGEEEEYMGGSPVPEHVPTPVAVSAGEFASTTSSASTATPATPARTSAAAAGSTTRPIARKSTASTSTSVSTPRSTATTTTSRLGSSASSSRIPTTKSSSTVGSTSSSRVPGTPSSGSSMRSSTTTTGTTSGVRRPITASSSTTGTTTTTGTKSSLSTRPTTATKSSSTTTSTTTSGSSRVPLSARSSATTGTTTTTTTRSSAMKSSTTTTTGATRTSSAASAGTSSSNLRKPSRLSIHMEGGDANPSTSTPVRPVRTSAAARSSAAATASSSSSIPKSSSTVNRTSTATSSIPKSSSTTTTTGTRSSTLKR